MRINTAERAVLNKILERKKKEEYAPGAVDLEEVLKEILRWANRFVPSESGSILLDDPTLVNRRKKGTLYFVACFGRGSKDLAGTTLPSNVGIVGRTYTSGSPYISKRVLEDEHFYEEIDKKTKYQTKSIICAPIKIKKSTIGVIELINRKEKVNFDQNDLELLKIFADYTSTFIQNTLDAKRFGEMSIRDNLTGLYNDRYFYDQITREVTGRIRSGGDLSLVFLDLDRFKEVNDTYGHLAGSRVLAEVGGLIAKACSKTDAIPARYGGDEFTVVLPGADLEAAVRFSEELRRTIQGRVFLRRRGPGGEKALKIKGVITASMGVASLGSSVETNGPVKGIRDALIKQADTAMYRSKKDGKNRTTRATGAVCPLSSAI